jgi:hypothetical protein
LHRPIANIRLSTAGQRFECYDRDADQRWIT